MAQAAPGGRRVTTKGGDMEFLWMIIVGGIVGAIAKLIMPGRDPGGIIVTIILGILGGIVGGFLFGLLGLGDGGLIGLIGAILGAILLLWIYRMVVSRRTTDVT
ncbi:MAG TPA: GlsB/YeaQ/YmgE family stress response membrane protein [Longimicrobiales bacterium]